MRSENLLILFMNIMTKTYKINTTANSGFALCGLLASFDNLCYI